MKQGCPSVHDLEQFLLGTLPDEQIAGIERHLAGGCPDCVGSLEASRPSDSLLDDARHVPDANLHLLGTDSAVAAARAISLPERLAHATPSLSRKPDADTLNLRPARYEFLDPPQSPDEIGRVGPYRVLSVLGRGGMGVVFEAHQPELDRVVALKMILDDSADDPERLRRFRAEAVTAAHLQHPHLVQVFEVGEHRGRPYISLEYLPGGNLSERLAGAPLPSREAAVLLATLAQAVQYAHEAGVVHRDLKPANVLLAGDGSPKIADFGLAKRLQASEGNTQTGQIMGTPSYLAPEQASGSKEVGPAADVYSLGAILYECLTGRPPFQGVNALETVVQVMDREPVAPSRLQPSVPRDLETICLKCLSKQPHRRYASAAALAEDCEAFLRGESIRARPVGPLERLAKWARRRPTAAALWGVCILAGLLLVVASVAFNVWQRGANASILQAKEKAEQQRDLLGEEQQKTKRLADAETRARADAQKERDLARKEQHKSEVTLYALQAHQVLAALEEQRFAQAEAILGATNPNLRSWEHGHLLARCRTRLERTVVFPAQVLGQSIPFGGASLPRATFACNRAGTQMALRYGDRAVLLWDLQTGKHTQLLHTTTHVVGSHLKYSLDGKRLVFGLCGIVDEKSGKHTASELAIADPATGKILRTLPGPTAEDGGIHPHYGTQDPVTGERTKINVTADPTFPLEFSTDGKHLAATGPGKAIALWDVESGKKLGEFHPRKNVPFPHVVQGQDGRLLVVTTTPEQTIEVHDLLTGEIRHELRAEKGRWVVKAVNGRYLAGPRPGTPWVSEILELSTGKSVGTYSGKEDRGVILLPSRGIRAVCFGERLQVVDLGDTKKSFTVTLPAGRQVTVAAMNSDESLLAYAETANVHVLDLNSRKALFAFRGRTADVLHLQFLPDGRLLSLHSDQAVRFWNLAAEPPTVFSPAKGEDFKNHRVAAFGRHALVQAVALKKGPRGSDLALGMRLIDLDGWDSRPLSAGVEIRPDGGQVVWAGQPRGTVTLHDVGKDQPDRTLTEVTGQRPLNVHAPLLRYSPAGDLLAVPRRDPEGAITILDTKTGKVRRVIPCVELLPRIVAFSPDSKCLAVPSPAILPGGKVFTEQIELWETEGDRPPRILRMPDPSFAFGLLARSNLVWSADGRCLAGVSRDGAVRVVNVNGKIECTLRADALYFVGVALTPDNKRVLVAASRESRGSGHASEVRVHERATGQRILTIPFPEPILGMTLGSDGRLVVVTADGALRVLRP